MPTSKALILHTVDVIQLVRRKLSIKHFHNSKLKLNCNLIRLQLDGLSVEKNTPLYDFHFIHFFLKNESLPAAELLLNCCCGIISEQPTTVGYTINCGESLASLPSKLATLFCT